MKKIVTLSRNLKKFDLASFFNEKSSYTLFYTSFGYNLFCYFRKSNKIDLNKLIIYKITNEELGTFISLAS